jgi:tetrahydromethanopterin S-methyltransferase subunit F
MKQKEFILGFITGIVISILMIIISPVMEGLADKLWDNNTSKDKTVESVNTTNEILARDKRIIERQRILIFRLEEERNKLSEILKHLNDDTILLFGDVLTDSVWIDGQFSLTLPDEVSFDSISFGDLIHVDTIKLNN